MGRLSPLDGIGPREIGLERLIERARERARILKDSAKRAVGIDPKALGKRGELVACNGVRRHISADDADGRVDGVECPELLGIQANH